MCDPEWKISTTKFHILQLKYNVRQIKTSNLPIQNDVHIKGLSLGMLYGETTNKAVTDVLVNT